MSRVFTTFPTPLFISTSTSTSPLSHPTPPQRLAKLRAFYHRWWGAVVLLVNLEVTAVHNWHRIMRKVQ